MGISSEILMFLPFWVRINFWMKFGVGNLWTSSSRKVGVKIGVARARVGNLWRGGVVEFWRVTKGDETSG